MNEKPGFEIKDLPNAFIGIFGIRTEAELPFDVLRRDGKTELRKIPHHIELESLRVGSRRDATNKSFEDLLAFIKGANVASKKYAMTAPVYEQNEGNNWRTAFYIEDDPKAIPSPLDPSLAIKQVQESIVAVYKFSGSASDAEVKKSTEKLANWIARIGAVAISEPRLAQFDPPFAIPFLRRNEIQIVVKLAKG